jgi:hypothetical protein
MESKLAENVRIKLTHWAALNQYEFLFEGFLKIAIIFDV